MPSVDELLDAAEVAEATLTETNDKIEIDADTRTMIIPDTERIFGVMSDEKGERKYFRCKRFVGNGIDLSKLSLRIVFQNASGLDTGRDKYIVTDLATDGEDYVTFSWELSRKVTAYKGIISFVVCAIKTKSDGTITNEWNTTLANGMVLEGLEVNGTQEQEEVAKDYYNQLEAELLKVANEQINKVQEVVKTIPSDYTQMQKDVSNLKEDIGEIYETDITSIGEYRQGQYIEFSTGKIKYSDNYETLVFANKQYNRISFLCGHTDDIPAAIAFFSNETSDTTSYQKQSVKATKGKNNYIVSIPNDCKVIAISNRKSSYEIKGSVSYSTDVAIKQALQNGEEIQTLKNEQKNSELLQGCFVADKYNDSSLVKKGLIFDDGTTHETDKNKYTLHISLENVRYIKYKNLYGKYKYGGKNLVGMTFYDDYHKISKSPEFTQELQSGVINLNDFPDAKYMRFCNYNNDLPVSVELYCGTEKEAKDRKKVYVGVYYFAGWSEWELPNLHFTKGLLQEFNGRMPVWGWFAHNSYRCDAWLYSPYISLNSGESTLSLTGSCVFNASNCSLNIKTVDGEWTPLEIAFDDTDPEIKTTTVDISGFSGKRIMIGFRIFNKNSDISPIWTINKVEITSGNETVHIRDFTGDNIRDYTTNDKETWKHGVPTLAYDVTNGYVGTAYDTGDTTIIDKEIILAKNKGIDYFILDWYYHNDGGSFDKDETEKEANNLGIQTFSKSAQKYNFKYIIMISNHGGFVIDGLENWKSAINYINETYVKDPSYFRYKGIPVVSVFEATKFNEVKAQINEYIISLGYPNGWIWQIVNENTWYGYWYDKHDESVPDKEQPYSKLVNDSKSKTDRFYYIAHDVYPCITTGTDLRAWKNRPGSYARHLDYCVPSVTEWKDFAQWAYDWVHAYKRDFKSIVVHAWNEMGEGGYLVPTAGDPQASFLCALEDVINSNSYPN